MNKKKIKKIFIASISIIVAIMMAFLTYDMYTLFLEPIYIGEYHLHDAGQLARMAEVLGDKDMQEALLKKASGIRGIHRLDVGTCWNDIFRLWEYLAWCKAMSLPVDEETVIEQLRPLYCEEVNLFTVDENLDVQENMPILYTTTQILLEYWPQVLDCEEFSLREGILNNVERCPFIYEPRRDLSAAEAGGGVILALGYLSDHDGVDYRYLLPDDVEEWLEIWMIEDKTSDRPDGTSMFARFAHYIWREDTVPFVQEYYNAMTEENLPVDIGEVQDLVFILREVDTTQNPVFYEALKQRIWEMIDQFEMRRILPSELHSNISIPRFYEKYDT